MLWRVYERDNTQEPSTEMNRDELGSWELPDRQEMPAAGQPAERGGEGVVRINQVEEKVKAEEAKHTENHKSMDKISEDMSSNVATRASLERRMGEVRN